ncbi:hypothetical protein AAZV13_02G089100 [Glycine max]
MTWICRQQFSPSSVMTHDQDLLGHNMQKMLWLCDLFHKQTAEILDWVACCDTSVRVSLCFVFSLKCKWCMDGGATKTRLFLENWVQNSLILISHSLLVDLVFNLHFCFVHA